MVKNILFGLVIHLVSSPLAQATSDLSDELLRASQFGNSKEVEELLKKGATAPLGKEPYGAAWLEAAKGDVLVGGGKKENVAVLALLKPKMGDVNVANPSGETALMLAVATGQVPTVKWLLENGVNPDLQDKAGRTAAHRLSGIFAVGTCKEIIAALKGRSANLALKDGQGLTPKARQEKVVATFEELAKKDRGAENKKRAYLISSTKECVSLLP